MNGTHEVCKMYESILIHDDKMVTQIPPCLWSPLPSPPPPFLDFPDDIRPN